MLNVHDEPSFQKESTLISHNTTPDGDEASPQKKAPLVKLNGTPERNESSYLKKAPPTKLHEKHAKDKPDRTTAYGATLKDGTHSREKKASLTKISGTRVLKYLAAFCVLGSVGAATLPSSPTPKFDADVPNPSDDTVGLEALRLLVREQAATIEILRVEQAEFHSGRSLPPLPPPPSPPPPLAPPALPPPPPPPTIDRVIAPWLGLGVGVGLGLCLGFAAIRARCKMRSEAERLMLQQQAVVIAATTTTHLDYKL